MLQSKFDYNKHPKSTTKRSIQDTLRFLDYPVRDNEKTHQNIAKQGKNAYLPHLADTALQNEFN